MTALGEVYLPNPDRLSPPSETPAKATREAAGEKKTSPPTNSLPNSPEKRPSRERPPLALLELTLPETSPPSYTDLIAQGQLLAHLARKADTARRLMVVTANRLLDEGCAPGSHYLKQGKYLVVRQRIAGHDHRTYIGADPDLQKAALSPFQRFRAYLEILELIAMLDRLSQRLLRHSANLCTNLEKEITSIEQAERRLKKL